MAAAASTPHAARCLAGERRKKESYSTAAMHAIRCIITLALVLSVALAAKDPNDCEVRASQRMRAPQLRSALATCPLPPPLPRPRAARPPPRRSVSPP